MATVTQQNSVAASIDQVASQMATAVSQSLTLNPGSTEADNISKLSTALGVAVSNQINQNITAAASASQTINTDGKSKGGVCSQNIHDIEFSSFQAAAAKGVLDATQVSSAVANLKQAVDQTAHAKQQSTITTIIIVLVVAFILIVVLGMVLKFMSNSKKKGPAKKGHASNVEIEMQPPQRKKAGPV
jgi:preprotein translocase subunit SecE